MPNFENKIPEEPTKEEKELYHDEVLMERELIGRACKTLEEKNNWIKENGAIFREIVQDSDIIEMIKEDRQKAIEEIKRRIEKKHKEG